MTDNPKVTRTSVDSENGLAEFPCCLFIFSEKEFLKDANSYSLNSLGYTKDEVVGKMKFEDLLTAGSKILFQTHFLPLLNLKDAADEVVLSLRSKKDVELPQLFNITIHGQKGKRLIYAAGLPIPKRNQYEQGLLETIRNSETIFSENKALINLKQHLESSQLLLEKKLRETNRLNDEHKQLNKVLAHDLQEPVRKILYYADILSNSDGNLGDGLLKISDATLKLRSISDSLQQFYSLDYKFDRAALTDLRNVIEQAKLESGAAEVPCDTTQMKIDSYTGQPKHFKGLFTELFKNALKFRHTDRPLKIHIETKVVKQNIYKETDGKYKYEDFLRIKFSDNGIGFSDRHANKIFQLFQKLHPNDGLGIGLSYCKKIVELYHGSITAASKPNVGTIFTIMLPFDPDLVLQ